MIPMGDEVLTARLHGAWLDRSLDYDARVGLDADLLRITYDGARSAIELPVTQLLGSNFRDGTLTVHAEGGVVVSLSDAPDLDRLRDRLESVVCLFPAQTLSLRGFGSERSAPGSDHDQWFEALLTARRVAEETRVVDAQRRAFDAPRLVRHAQLTREAWAAARFSDAADRRALVAELEEIARPFSAALRQMEHASLRLRQAPDERRFETWRRWVATVQRGFRAADDVWTLTIPALCDSRGARGALWRRVLRRGGKGAS